MENTNQTNPAQEGINAAQADALRAKMQTVEGIIINHLRIDNPTVQNSDSLDFHDLHIETLTDALLAAFEAGQRSR